MSKLLSRFLRYIKIDTTSIENINKIPSSDGQWELAYILKNEMINLGLTDAFVDQNCFSYASLPASKGYEGVPTLALLAHLDTAPDCLGKDVKPIIHKNYDGNDLIISSSVTINTATYPDILRYKGHDIVTSDGFTLLGADDKAGIAIIMNTLEDLIDSKINHGKIVVIFTPDEEVSVGGASIFDTKKFKADYGITVDGDGLGELNYETFNAYSYTVNIIGNNIHPAEAKDKMINACMLAVEFDNLLPKDHRPEHTEGYDGFIHLCEMECQVEKARMEYILREFDKDKLEQQKKLFKDAANQINSKYKCSCVTLQGIHEYSNPKEKILEHPEFLEKVKLAFNYCDIKPLLLPIRGGTDGSTITEKGLPCINIFASGHNYHSVREFVSVQGMEKSSEILLKIIELIAQ